MRRSSIVAVLAALMLVVTIVPAAATPPSGVLIESLVSFDSGGGRFTATGPAVDSGLICASGVTTQPYWKQTGFHAPTGVNFQVVKEFACDDGSGSFFVKLQVRSDRKGVNFSWTILGGTDTYANLHGSGKGTGEGIDGFDGILDLYSGAVHSN